MLHAGVYGGGGGGSGDFLRRIRRQIDPPLAPAPHPLSILAAHVRRDGPRALQARHRTPLPPPKTRPLPPLAGKESVFASLLRALDSAGGGRELEDTLAAAGADRMTPKEQTVLLRRRREWRSAVRILRWLRSRRETYGPNVIHYNVVLRALGLAQRWDELRLCWIEMAADGVVPTNNTYSMLVDVYAKAGLVCESLLWVKHMKARGIFPDEVTMSTVVRVLKEAKEYDRAHHFYKNWLSGEVMLQILDLGEKDGDLANGLMSAKHFLSTELFKAGGRPGPVPINLNGDEEGEVRQPRLAATYNALIDMYGKAGRLKEAAEVFGDMLRAGVAPDAVTFNTMIHICGSNGQLAEAVSLFDKMQDRGVSPDVKTYNIFLSLYGEIGDVQAVLKWYWKISEVGLVPDVVTSRAVLHILCKRKMIEDVDAVLFDMERHNVCVDDQSLPVVLELYIGEGLMEKGSSFMEKYCFKDEIASKTSAAMMDVYAERGLWAEAESIFARRKDSGRRMEVLEYNVMIKAYGKAKNYDKAIFLFGSMKSTGAWPDEFSYNSLVQMLSCGDLVMGARDHLARMQEAGFRPLCATFSSVIACYTRLVQVDEAVAVYEEMIRLGVEPNEIVYGSLVNAFAEAGRVDEAFRYFRMMEESNIVANQITLTTLIKAYSKVGFWKEAQDVFAKIRNFPGGPDIVASNSMIALYADLGMVQEAESIFYSLKEKGQADGVSFATMMYLYKNMGMLDKATEVAQEMQESGLLRNSASFNKVMTSYATSGQLRDCGELLHQMLEKKILPDQTSFRTMFVVLKKGGIPVEMVSQIQDAYENGRPYSRNAIITMVFSVVGLHDFALESCEAFAKAEVGLDLSVYNVSIFAYGSANEIDKALRMYMRMQDAGMVPDVVTYICLVVCYGRVGMIEGVKRIYNQLKFGEIDLNESLFMAIVDAYKAAGRTDLASLVDQVMKFSFSNGEGKYSFISDAGSEEDPNATDYSDDSAYFSEE